MFNCFPGKDSWEFNAVNDVVFVRMPWATVNCMGKCDARLLPNISHLTWTQPGHIMKTENYEGFNFKHTHYAIRA